MKSVRMIHVHWLCYEIHGAQKKLQNHWFCYEIHGAQHGEFPAPKYIAVDLLVRGWYLTTTTKNVAKKFWLGMDWLIGGFVNPTLALLSCTYILYVHFVYCRNVTAQQIQNNQQTKRNKKHTQRPVPSSRGCTTISKRVLRTFLPSCIGAIDLLRCWLRCKWLVPKCPKPQLVWGVHVLFNKLPCL